ncbi:MAG: phosphotransferase, partial [Bacteroidota bacterium]
MPQKVRPGEELPEAQLLQFMHEHQLVNSPDTELHIAQFSNGFSNLTYSVATDEKEYVLRRPPFGAIKRGHDMGREYKVLSALNQAFPKAPKAYAFTDDPAWLGAPFYLMEKKEGIILSAREAKKRQIEPAHFQTIARSWLDTFVELH